MKLILLLMMITLLTGERAMAIEEAPYTVVKESGFRENGFEVSGEPVWARYNPPFTFWFLRRYEILIPIALK